MKHFNLLRQTLEQKMCRRKDEKRKCMMHDKS